MSVQKSIGILESIGVFNAQFSKDVRVVKAWIASTNELLDVCIYYRSASLFGRMLKMIAAVLRVARLERPVHRGSIQGAQVVLRKAARIAPPRRMWRTHREEVARLRAMGVPRLR